MSSMSDHIAIAIIFVCAQSGHRSWYKLHIPSCIFVRFVKISSMRFAVESSVCSWPLPSMKFWTFLDASLVVVDCSELMLGIVCLLD